MLTFKPSHFNTPRPGAGRVVIVCSDGEQTRDCLNGNCQATAIAAATPLKAGGATVFSWGFGTISMDTLTGIASSASKVHAYTAHAHAHALQMHMHMHMHCTATSTPTPNPQPSPLVLNLSSVYLPSPALRPYAYSLTSPSPSPYPHLHLRLTSKRPSMGSRNMLRS